MNVFLPEPKPAAFVREEAQSVASAASLVSTPEENAAIAVLLETAENAEQKRRVVQTTKWLLFLSWFVFTTLYLLYLGFVGQVGRGWQAFNMTITNTGPLIVSLFIQVTQPKTKRLQDAATALLKLPNEPRRLLPLIDSLNLPQTPEWKKEAYPALIEQLWNLSANEAALSLDTSRRATLRGVLADPYAVMPNAKRRVRNAGHFDDATSDLAVAAMRTLAQIGDTKTAQVLKKIINADAKTPNEAVVRDAARAVLPALKQKIAENEAVQKQIRACLAETLRDPQKILAEYLDTLAPEEAKIALMNYLRSRAQYGRFLCATFAATSLPFAAIVLSGGFQTKNAIPAALATLAAFGFSVLVGLSVFATKWPLSGNESSLVSYELARRSENDTRLLPVLIDAARALANNKQADAVKKALVRLLPQLKPGDAALVPPAQRAYLRSWLSLPRRKSKDRNASQTLTIAALDAAGAIGDTKALAKAEKIARRTMQGTYRETELHEAALRCAENLRRRKQP